MAKKPQAKSRQPAPAAAPAAPDRPAPFRFVTGASWRRLAMRPGSLVLVLSFEDGTEIAVQDQDGRTVCLEI